MALHASTSRLQAAQQCLNSALPLIGSAVSGRVHSSSPVARQQPSRIVFLDARCVKDCAAATTPAAATKRTNRRQQSPDSSSSSRRIFTGSTPGLFPTHHCAVKARLQPLKTLCSAPHSNTQGPAGRQHTRSSQGPALSPPVSHGFRRWGVGASCVA